MSRRLAALLAAFLMVAGACAYKAATHEQAQPLGVRIQQAAGDRYEVIYYPETHTYRAESKTDGSSYTCAYGNDSAHAAFSIEVDGREVDCADN